MKVTDMRILRTSNNVTFEIEYGGPVSFTENIVFLTKILNSDIDTVHGTFKNPENTRELTLKLYEEDPGEVFTGYTRYFGFSLENDGGITVTLKKNLEV